MKNQKPIVSTAKDPDGETVTTTKLVKLKREITISNSIVGDIYTEVRSQPIFCLRYAMEVTSVRKVPGPPIVRLDGSTRTLVPKYQIWHPGMDLGDLSYKGSDLVAWRETPPEFELKTWTSPSLIGLRFIWMTVRSIGWGVAKEIHVQDDGRFAMILRRRIGSNPGDEEVVCSMCGRATQKIKEDRVCLHCLERMSPGCTELMVKAGILPGVA